MHYLRYENNRRNDALDLGILLTKFQTNRFRNYCDNVNINVIEFNFLFSFCDVSKLNIREAIIQHYSMINKREKNNIRKELKFTYQGFNKNIN